MSRKRIKKKTRHETAPSQAPGPHPARPEEGQGRKGAALRLAAGLALLAIAVYLRSRKTSPFANITTGDYSANNLLKDVADVWPIIRSVGGGLFRAFATTGLVPVFLFLLPAVLLIAGALPGLRKRDKPVFSFLEKRKARAVFLAALAVITLAGCLAAHFAVVGHYPAIGDEFCYLFGADELASGKLYAASPPLKDPFQYWSVINDGKWYGKVTIGWPLLLAAGRAGHLEFLINPILAALSVLMLFLIGELLYGAEGGLLAAFWGLATPFFIMMSGTYFPHTATAFFSLLFIYGMLRAFKEDRRAWPVLSGLSMTFLLLIRPADAGVVFLGMAPLMAYHFFTSGNRKKAAAKIGVLVALFAAGIGLLMLINQVQNGDPLLFGYAKYGAGETWGFGANGHTPLKGLWNTAYSLMRAGAWGVPLAGLFLLVSLIRKDWTTRSFMAQAVGFTILYAGFYTLATFEIGPRYYLPMVLLAFIPATGGALFVRDLLKRKKAPGSEAFVAALVFSTLIFQAVGVWPRMTASVKAQMALVSELPRVLAHPPVEAPSLIFLRDHLYLKNTYLTRNYWRFQDSPHVYVLYLTPEENRKVLDMFPRRHAYSTVVDPVTRTMSFAPYVDNAETFENYLAAGLNYVEFDPRQAVGALAKALALRPDDPQVMMSLARAYDMAEDRSSAVGTYSMVVKSGEPSLRDMALFFLATDLRELGRTNDALGVYEELARTGQDPKYQSRAAAWLKRMSR
jgi:hypothetical protein